MCNAAALTGVSYNSQSLVNLTLMRHSLMAVEFEAGDFG